MESRELLSWSSVPSTLGWSAPADVTFYSNARGGTDVIRGGEVDVVSFVAPRSGTFTFKAGKYASQIDTITGLYRWNGQLLAGNDDSGGTTDSSFTAYLNGGERYALAITNYTGHANGSYRWSIEGPPLYLYLNNNAGSGITSFASASLSGNTLSIYVSGRNNSNFSTYTHRANVYLIDANNQPIHSGSWSAFVKTGGRFVPGVDSSKSYTINFDLSGWDLRRLRNLRMTLY